MLLLNDKIRDVRKRRGLTYPKLEKLTGINIRTLHRYEKGDRVPTFTNLIKLAYALDVSLYHFCTNAPDEIKEIYKKLERVY